MFIDFMILLYRRGKLYSTHGQFTRLYTSSVTEK